jgi:hypothetical protein
MRTRKEILTVLCALAIGPVSLRAQEPRHALSVDLFLPAMSPVSRLSGEDTTFVPINVKYPHMLTDHQALTLKMGFTYSWGSDGDNILDACPMLALDWHPFHTGLKGFYLGPSLFFNYRATRTPALPPQPTSTAVTGPRWAATWGTNSCYRRIWSLT